MTSATMMLISVSCQFFIAIPTRIRVSPKHEFVEFVDDRILRYADSLAPANVGETLGNQANRFNRAEHCTGEYFSYIRLVHALFVGGELAINGQTVVTDKTGPRATLAI